jgi:hypothetical protein
MGLISKFVSRVFGKKSKKGKGEDTFVVNVADSNDDPDAPDKCSDIQNQHAARNAPILFVQEETKDSKMLLQASKAAEAVQETVPRSLDQDLDSALDKSSDISQSSISSPPASSKKPPTCPRKAKSPTQDNEQGAAADSNLDSNSLLDGPRTPRGGFLSGSLTPRGLSGSLTPRGFGGSLTPRGISGALTPRGGGGHSFQRLD